MQMCSIVKSFIIYKGCFESNVTCFTMLDYKIIGGCCWYNSRDWIFSPIIPVHFVATWQRGRLNKRHLTSAHEVKVWHWSPPCRKVAPPNFYLHLLNAYGDQTLDVGTLRWLVVCFRENSDVKDKSHSR